jgi:hypothetical protein
MRVIASFSPTRQTRLPPAFAPCAICMGAAYLQWKAARQKNNLFAQPDTKQSTYQSNKKS